MKRNIAVFTATFIIVALLLAACGAVLFLFFGGTSLRECLDLSFGDYAREVCNAPTLGERLSEDTAESIAFAADTVTRFLPFRKRVMLQGILTGVFFLKF